MSKNPEKKVRCHCCGRRFKTREAQQQHFRDVRKNDNAEFRKLDRKAKCEVALDVFSDLSDGAFFAAAEGMFGLEPSDFAE